VTAYESVEKKCVRVRGTSQSSWFLGLKQQFSLEDNLTFKTLKTRELLKG